MLQKIAFSLLFLGNIVLYAQEGTTPFLPEMFRSFPNVRDFAPGPNRDELYFTVESYKKEFSAIYHTRQVKGQWLKPEVAPFSGQYRDLEPFFSPDGLTLFFVSKRPPAAGELKPDADIWYVKREAVTAAWSEPKHLEGPVNTEKDEYYPSVAANGNLYFTRESDDPKRKEDLFISVFSNGAYLMPMPLSDSINSVTFEFNAYVTPDEQHLLFSSYGRTDDMGGSDLYISHKNAAGEWTTARNLGKPVNSRKIDYCPYWDQAEKVLYFTSERSLISPEQALPLDTEALEKLFSEYSNGLSRIYRVAFDGTIQ